MRKGLIHPCREKYTHTHIGLMREIIVDIIQFEDIRFGLTIKSLKAIDLILEASCIRSTMSGWAIDWTY